MNKTTKTNQETSECSSVGILLSKKSMVDVNDNPITKRLSESEIEDLIKEEAGLTFCGQDDEGNNEYIGTVEQWEQSYV
jgi:hypothetical protein